MSKKKNNCYNQFFMEFIKFRKIYKNLIKKI